MRNLSFGALITLSLLPLLSKASDIITSPESTQGVDLNVAEMGEVNEVRVKNEQQPNLPTSALPVEIIRVLGSKDAGLELSSDKILKVPGAGNDPIKAIESFPGVILADGIAPAVRGSSPQDMYYQTDDVPVGYVFHNDGYSTFHPNLIKSFELKTGAWESTFSDSIGGVIDTTLRDPEITDFTGVADISLLRTGILVESKLTDTSAFYFAARQSLIHLYIDAIIKAEEDFVFTKAPVNNDYQFKYINYLNDDNKVVVQATGANDDVNLLFSDESTEVKQNPDLVGGIGLDTYYHNQSVIWTNESDFGETKYIANRLVRNDDLYVGQIINIDAVTTDNMFKIMNTQIVSDGLLVSGIDLRQQNVDYKVIGKLSPCNDEFEVCPPSYYAPTLEETAELDINFFTAFSDYTWDLTDAVLLRLGGVVNYNNFNDQTIAEPRVMVKWQAIDDYTFKLAYGQHHQWFRQYKYLSETFGSLHLEQVEAEHYVAGIEYEGESEWAWRVEAYYKDMDNLIVSNPSQQVPDQQIQSLSDAMLQDDLDSADNYLNAGVGSAYGIELLLNKAFTDNWYGWLSIAYSKTERENLATGEAFTYAYDIPWIVNAVATYEFNEQWQLGGRWRFQSGSVYTPITGSEPVYPLVDNIPDSSQEPIFYDPINGDLNSERFDNFHRLDIRLDYKTTLFGQNTKIYFEVLNVYGNKGLASYDYNEDYSTKEPSYQFPEFPLPSIGIQMEF